MTQTAEALHTDPQPEGLAEASDTPRVQLVQAAEDHVSPGPDRPGGRDGADYADRAWPSGGPARGRPLRSWPLLVLALPAAAAVWSGWVGIGQLTGFGEVHPLPGIWDSLHLDTAVTLPVGVEAYAAYALRAWLSSSTAVSPRTRRFARWSATGSLVLGMAGQVTYHLLTQAHSRHAPWGVTTAVSCLPVLVLGMGAALAHMIRADASSPDQTAPTWPRTSSRSPGPWSRGKGPGRQHDPPGQDRRSNRDCGPPRYRRTPDIPPLTTECGPARVQHRPRHAGPANPGTVQQAGTPENRPGADEKKADIDGRTATPAGKTGTPAKRRADTSIPIYQPPVKLR